MSPHDQPRIRRNEWQALQVPALGEWTPTLSVSVVVPAYAAGRLLPTVLAGLAAASYPAHLLEVVVVDDGPGPEPLVLPEIRPERTRVLPAAPHGPGGWGRANACHTGAMVADGDVLHWLDADMLCERDQVEAQMRWHHVLDHVVTLGTKSFVDPSPALAHTPAEVREAVTQGRLAQWWEGLEQTPHEWVEHIFARTDDLRDAGWQALRTHTGAVAAVGRQLYLESGGMDTDLRLGEDITLGHRLAAVGAVFVPDREAVSWHLGQSHVMSRRAQVNDFNDPLYADRVPGLRAKRRRGRAYSAPYAEVVLDSRGLTAQVTTDTVDAVLASSLTDLAVTLVGDWDSLTDERAAVLDDPGVATRILHSAYSEEPRVRLATSMPDASDPRPGVWRIVLPGAVHAPAKMALERVLLHLDHTHEGLRLLRLPDDSVVRIERTAAFARALRLRREGEDLDDVVAEVAGAAETPAGPEGRVRFVEAAEASPGRYLDPAGPARNHEDAWVRVERGMRRNR